MKKFIACITLALLAGCGTLHEEYVRADRSTFDLFAPKIEKWLEHEPGVAVVNSETVQILHDKLTSWNSRLKRAELAVGEE